MRPRAFTYVSLVAWMMASVYLAFIAITTSQDVRVPLAVCGLFLLTTSLSYEQDLLNQRVRELEEREFHTLCTIHDRRGGDL